MATIGESHVPSPPHIHGLRDFPPYHTGVLMMSATYAFVPLRTPEGLNLYFKHAESPWTFRVLPVRDPDQPRLWCLRLEACAGPSLNAKTARVDPFYTSLSMTREQIAVTLDSIRQDTPGWLQATEQQELRRWLGRIVKMPVPSDFTSTDPPARALRATPAAPLLEPEASLTGDSQVS